MSVDDLEPSIVINPNARPEVKHIGKERTPIIVIDDFAASLDEIREHAHYKVDFNHVEKQMSMYPGVRTDLPRRYVIDCLSPLNSLLHKLFNVPIALNLKPRLYVFSLISTPEKSLEVLQRMPHFDTSRAYYFAALHYLNETPHGATAFFRHKPTGFERITDTREQEYFSKVKEHMNSHGEPIAQYFVKSDEHFECYEKIEYQTNRMLIYPGNLLHSTLVNASTDIDGDPKTGRLTANMFIEFV